MIIILYASLRKRLWLVDSNIMAIVLCQIHVQAVEYIYWMIKQ